MCAIDAELASNLLSERLRAMVTSVLRNETGAGKENKCVHTNLFIPTNPVRVLSVLRFHGSLKSSLSERKYLRIFSMSFNFYFFLNYHLDMLVAGKEQSGMAILLMLSAHN